nr:Os12g0285650 [Ipomoea batatas]
MSKEELEEKGNLVEADLIIGSTLSSDAKAYRSSSSEENEDVRQSEPLLLKELDDRKSLVSKKVFSSSSVSSSAASTLSLSSSESLTLASEEGIQRYQTSLTCSSIRRFRNFSVETEMLSKGAINSLLESLGNISFTVCSASVQAILSSLVSALKCSLFVPVKIENLLSSDLLSRIDETYKKLLRL